MVDDVKISEKPSAPKRDSFFNSVWVDVAGVVGTLVAGAVAAYKKTNDIFYQNIKVVPEIGSKRAVIKDRKLISEEVIGLHQQSREKVEVIFGEIEKDYKTAESAVKRKELLSRLRPHNKKSQKLLNDTIRDKWGIENVFHRFEAIRPHQKGEVVLNALATVVVTLGGLATLAGVRYVFNEQQKLEDRIDGIESKGIQR